VIFTSISFPLSWFCRLSETLCCSSSLCDICCLSCFVQVFFFGSDCQISLDPVQIQSMTLASSTLQIRRHGYSGDLNIVISVGFCTLSFYAINMDVVSLFADSSFLFLANSHYIDVLYQFEWMNIIYFCQKKKKVHVFHNSNCFENCYFYMYIWCGNYDSNILDWWVNN